MDYTVEFEYEIDGLGVTLDVVAEMERSEAANINMAEPEKAYPASGPNILSLAVRNMQAANPDVVVDGIAVQRLGKWVSLDEVLRDMALEKAAEFESGE